MKTLLLNCKCPHSALASISNILKEPNMNVAIIIICATLVLLAVVLMYGMYLIKKRKREDERSMKKDVWEMEERRRFLEFCYDMAKKKKDDVGEKSEECWNIIQEFNRKKEIK